MSYSPPKHIHVTFMGQDTNICHLYNLTKTSRVKIFMVVC